MGDPIFLFFALLLGYIGVAIWIGLGVGRWLARHARRPVQILAQVLCVAVLLYLPVWDYIPGKILFDRHCAATGGLQTTSESMLETVFFEGKQAGYCFDCVSALGSRAIKFAETYIDAPLKSHVPVIPTEGYVRLWLTPDDHAECDLLKDYFEREEAIRSKSSNQRLRMFWTGQVPEDFVRTLTDTCISWEPIEHPSAEFVLKPRTHGQPRFYWTYLYESRVELRRRADDSLVASYATYQYHPWLNATLLAGAPRMFIFRCPGPDRDGQWSRSFSESKLFIEMARHDM